jgi:hypothetical protein
MLIVESRKFCEGAKAAMAKSNKLDGHNNFVDYDSPVGRITFVDHISLIGFIELIKLIGCVGHTNNFVGPSKLIIIYSKTSLHLRKDCGIFCEGEWEQQQHIDGHTNLVGVGLIVRISLVSCMEFIGHDGLIGCIGRNDLGGISLISIVGLICFIGLIGLDSLVGFGLNGPIGISIIVIRLGIIRIDFKIETKLSQCYTFVRVVGCSV